MYGVLSGTKQGKRGVTFYRNLTLVGIMSQIVIGLGSFFLFPFSAELIWDRAMLIGIMGATLFYSFRPNVDSERYRHLVYVVFYLYNIQIIFSWVINGCSVGYYLISFLSIQICALLFKHQREAFLFLSFSIVASCIPPLLVEELNQNDRLMFVSMSILSGIAYIFFIRIKDRFIQDMKMHRDLMRSITNKTENAIFITTTMGVIQDFNECAVSMFGMSRDQMLNQDFTILRKQSLTDEQVIRGLQELDSNQFWTMECDLVKGNGEHFNAYLSIGLVERWGRKFLVYHVQDITKKKEFEVALLSAKELAEEAVKLKSQFLAVMSHEIRTPLNGVLGMASLLHYTNLDSKQKVFVDIIQRSGQSLMVLINDVLDFSKMESGKMKLEMTVSDVKDAIYEVSDLLSPHAASKGVSLELDIASNVPDRLLTDNSRLKQVLLNFIGNAIKFTEKGKVRISCVLESINLSLATIRIEVIDTGIGIPAEKIHLLFQSFSQVDSSTSRKFGGTGLGLAISKQIVELLGGSIEVRSQLNEGSTFSFTLKGEVVEERLSNPSNPFSAYQLNLEEVVGLKILIAEDNLVNQNVLLFMLRNLNLEADVCSNGIEALQKVSSTNYDIIYIDVQMPEIDGLEVTKKIRMMDGIVQPHIIAITANSALSDKQACIAAGMDSFISKPFLVDHINESLYHFINSKAKLTHR